MWNPVVKEPVVSDGSGDIFEPLVANLWGFGSHRPRHCLTLEWLILMPGHIVVTPPLLCYVVLRLRRKASIQSCCASFTPLCVSMDGLLAPEARFFCATIK